jgi:hypothetical protein
MAKNEPVANRHHYRVWLKLALETGVLEKLPPQYDPDDSQGSQPTELYARQLLAELRDTESSRRPLAQILADAERFRAWVDFRQKVTRRLILSEGASAVVPEEQPSTRPAQQNGPRQRRPGSASPQSNPMWDDWLDG